jgi:hypothetical protein
MPAAPLYAYPNTFQPHITSRAAQLDHSIAKPNWAIINLQPHNIPFKRVIRKKLVFLEWLFSGKQEQR